MMMSPTKKGNIGTGRGKDSEFSVTDNVSKSDHMRCSLGGGYKYLLELRRKDSFQSMN